MAQSAIVDFNSAIGNLKTVYAGYENVLPKEYILMKEFSFDEGNKVGDEYQYGVELTRPHGFTSGAPGTFPLLNQPIARQVPKAKLKPYQHYLRERVTYETLALAATSEQAAKAELGATVQSMRESMLFRQEVLALYGQQGIGTLGTVTAASNAASVTSATWAEGIWAGNENMVLSVVRAGVFVKDITIANVDTDNLTLKFNAGDLNSVLAGDVLFFQGGSATTELVGIKTILLNTGVQYNIDASAYSLWKGNRNTASANTDLGFKLATQLDARIRSRGGMGEQLGLCNPDTFTTLIASIEAQRDFSSDQYNNMEIDRGSRRLRFFSPVGVTEIMPHPFCMRGDYFSLRRGKWLRAGATDPTFNIPSEGGKVLFDLQDYPGKEMRIMADNTWFTPKPAGSGIITGLTFGGSVTL